MKKLIVTAFAFLVLIPCVGHSMDNQENERGTPKIKTTAPKNQSPYSSGFKGPRGKFVGTDTKRDVAVFQEPSHDSISTRVMNILESWWQTPSVPPKPKK